MPKNVKFPFLPLPLEKPPELKGIIDTAPSMIQSIIYGIKAADQSIAAIDNAIKAIDSLMIGMDNISFGVKTTSEITSVKDAISALKQAEQTLDPDLIEKAIAFFANYNTKCPIAEYLSIGLTHAKYGNKEKAREVIRKVLEELGEKYG